MRSLTEQVFSHVAEQARHEAFREEVRDALVKHYRAAEKQGDAAQMEMYAAALIAVVSGSDLRWTPIGLDLP